MLNILQQLCIFKLSFLCHKFCIASLSTFFTTNLFLHYYHSTCLKHMKSFHLFLFWHHLSFFTIIWRTMHPMDASASKINYNFWFFSWQQGTRPGLVDIQAKTSFICFTGSKIYLKSWKLISVSKTICRQ